MVGPWFREVRYHDPFAAQAPDGAVAVGLDELFSTSDVISLHCPSLPSTRNLVNRERLALMGADTLLVNVSRGDLIDEHALLEGLEAGTPRRAALDVLTTEPPEPDHPLLHHPRVIVTNHMAWLSTDALDRVRSLLARRCALALTGGDAETVVNARDLGLAT
jgi:phosphoglycerate dehydrogenase-like enzyme